MRRLQRRLCASEHDPHGWSPIYRARSGSIEPRARDLPNQLGDRWKGRIRRMCKLDHRPFKVSVTFLDLEGRQVTGAPLRTVSGHRIANPTGGRTAAIPVSPSPGSWSGTSGQGLMSPRTTRRLLRTNDHRETTTKGSLGEGVRTPRASLNIAAQRGSIVPGGSPRGGSHGEDRELDPPR